MKLSLKSLDFVLAALEHFAQHHDRQLAEDGISEDDVSDLVNDRRYLKAIQHDFEKHREELLKERDTVAADV